MALSRFQLWYGRDAAPAETHTLRAGPLTAELVGADLRHVRVGDVEIVQRIYVAVRDKVWNTIPAAYADFQYDIGDDRFTVRFSAHHRYQDIDYSWQGALTGRPDGSITYVMDGVTHAAFPYCKIGFNIHHPLEGSVGRPYRAQAQQGTISGTLPTLIDPQRVENGLLTAIFPPYDALAIDVQDGLTVQFTFEGDLFEMQDHRNWTDANFKTYGTPMSIPVPMEAQAGQTMRQTVSVSVAGTLPRGPVAPRQPRVEIGAPTGQTLPPIGTMMPGHGGALAEREADLLRRLRLDHVRVDLHLTDPSYQEALQQAVESARGLGAGIELALFVNEDTAAQLETCAGLFQGLPTPLARVFVFQERSGFSSVSGTTPAHLVRQVRERLQGVAPGVPVAGGTTQFFAEINRDRPDVTAMDGVVYSINPQVHACDDTSLVENLEAQAETVTMARTFCDDRPIFISPITLIGRGGPYAAGPPEPDGLPGNVDVRQASLFGAGWTAGSVKYLARGAAALTYYEATGWLGIVETAAGAPLPDRFPSLPGAAFPLYHVLADLAEWKGGELLDVRLSDRLAVEGLALRVDGQVHLLVANMSAEPRTVTVGPLDAPHVRLRALDEESAPLAMTEPERFRTASAVQDVTDGELRLSLSPYAVVRIDVEEETA